MTLILDLTRSENQSIDNTNKAFEGTVYSKSHFTIFYRKLSRTQEFAIEKRYTKHNKGKAVINVAARDNERFVTSVVDWDDICGPDGHSLPCTPENKKLLSERCASFANLVMLAMFQDETHVLDDEEDVPEDKKEDVAMGN